MTEPMKIRAKVIGTEVEVKLLIAHEMETGQRNAPDGSLIQAWYIQNLIVKCNAKVVLQAYWGPSISKNPFLSFSFSGGRSGDIIEVTWIDNKNSSRTDRATVT
jgi:sulfur-oxidizing protein SoxZ